MFVLALISTFLASAIIAVTFNMQSVTRYLAESINREIWQAVQSALTPKHQKTRNLLLLPLLIAPIILGFISGWIGGIVIVVVQLLLILFFRAVFGRSSIKYFYVVGSDLTRRQADYLKENDKMRADAAKEYLDGVMGVIDSMTSEDIPISKLPSLNNN